MQLKRHSNYNRNINAWLISKVPLFYSICNYKSNITLSVSSSRYNQQATIPELKLISVIKNHFPAPKYNRILINRAVFSQSNKVAFAMYESYLVRKSVRQYWRNDVSEKYSLVEAKNICELRNRALLRFLSTFTVSVTLVNILKLENSNVMSMYCDSVSKEDHPTHRRPFNSFELAGPNLPSVSIPVPF